MLITTIFRSFVFLCILAGSSQALPLLGADNLIKEMKGKLFSGKGTFYEVGPGSCGQSNSNAAKVVALNLAQMGNSKLISRLLYCVLISCEKKKKDPNPNKNSHCGQTVSITGDNGATTAEVVDTCPSCPSGK